MSHFCAKCGAFCSDGTSHCPNCGELQNTSQQPVNPGPNNNPLTPDMPMKWFKFVIYFQLFANCVLNALSAIGYLTGSVYGELIDQVYGYAGGLKGLDIFMGLAMLATAAAAIYVRMRLAKFCTNGPKLYLIFLGVNAGLTVIYTVAQNVIVSSSALAPYWQPDYTSVVSSVTTTVVMLICNITYFKKRSHLFVNS